LASYVEVSSTMNSCRRGGQRVVGMRRNSTWLTDAQHGAA
jgi:hypothetical protein